MSNWSQVVQATAIKLTREQYIKTNGKRRSGRYAHWRWLVLQRDHAACRSCGATNRVEAHHIVRWADNPHLRFKKANGITLCVACHQKGHRGNGLPFDVRVLGITGAEDMVKRLAKEIK